ncbi:MAG: CheR family methyltransferase [Sphingomonadaceae bacterium]
MSLHPNSAAVRILGGMLEARTGQHIPVGRTWRVETALKPIVRELGLGSIDALVGRITQRRDAALSSRIVEALLNNESSFFRDPGVFALLGGPGLDRLIETRNRVRRLRIWCAGCSTGQEPYSIAMMLREPDHLPAGWTVEIAATDVSAAVIAKARSGRYSQFEVQRGLPVRTMLRHFVQQGEDWIIEPPIRQAVRFATHNLLDPAPGKFDLILCRNVMMYFGAETRTKVFDRLAAALEPGGILMLGAGETVLGQTQQFVSDPNIRGLYVAAGEVGRRDKRVATG